MLNTQCILSFLSNKYSKYYYNIINNALQMKRIKLPKNNKDYIYYELHHIIPKSIKPEFRDLKLNPWNTVLLTPKEHFICHLLLTKMVCGIDRQKMCYAFRAMCNKQNNNYQNRFVSRIYEHHKKTMSATISNPNKGKTFDEIYGTERATELKIKFKKRKTRGKLSIEEKQQLSNSMRERSINAPWKRFMQTNGYLPKTECPHCLKLVDPGNYARHHGDNCKRTIINCPICNTSFSSLPLENRKYCCKDCAMQARHKDVSEDLI